MYAIVRTGGKQYRVEEGRSVVVERLPVEEGETVELKDVLLIAQNDDVTVGAPIIDGARVVAEVEENGRHKKIVVFKYKAKVRARTKNGHRQRFTKLAVREILLPGQEPKTAKPKRRTKKDEAAEATPAEAQVETVVAEPEAEAPVAEPAVEEKPKRTRRAAPKAAAADDKPKAPRAKRTPAKPKADADAKPKPKPRARRKPTEDKTE